ncbi:hypothetical protein ACWEPM_38160 [Streptomyces sp. NPDC004244]
MPNGAQRSEYGQQIGPQYAVVLAVPTFAARHAEEHTRGSRGRVVVGPVVAEGASVGGEVQGLLRAAFPYLEPDTADDGDHPEPSAAVRAAREARRLPDPGVRERGDYSYARYNALVSGRWSWVPDDTAGGTAEAAMPTLPESI